MLNCCAQFSIPVFKSLYCPSAITYVAFCRCNGYIILEIIIVVIKAAAAFAEEAKVLELFIDLEIIITFR
jgi:hypothetical protein